jgi:hypothetical protein
MSTIVWNGKQQDIKGTILEDIINGFWLASEDIYYDNLATQYDDEKFVDTTLDRAEWHNTKES